MLILTPLDFSTAPATDAAANASWTRSANGVDAADHGQCAISLLPRDDDVVLVVPPRAMSWHRLTLPKVASARLRAVLDGMLEDRVLAETNTLHFALEPDGRPGQTVWVAACDKAWLRGWLQLLESAGRPVSRIVPAIWPLAHLGPLTNTDSLEALHWAHDASGQAWLASASALGVSLSPLSERVSGWGGDSSLSSLLPGMGVERPDNPSTTELRSTDRCLADPSLVALAEHALNQRFEPVPQADWLLRCAQSDWNLAQFDFSLSSGVRRGQRLQKTLRQWRSAPAWRAARWGLAALVGVQLLGLNAAAWHERSALKTKQQAITQTLQQSFPQVTLVLDAPVQMQRELARMQQAGGALTHGDLETMLAALASASDAPEAPSAIQYNTGEGHFNGWSAESANLQALEQSLQTMGWRVQLEGNNLILRPGQP